AVTIKALVKHPGSSDHASGRGGTRLVRPIHDPDEPVPLAILYSLDAGPDSGTVKPVKGAMDRSARQPVLAAGSCGKDDVPMGSLIQPWEVPLPDFVIFA